MGLFDSVISAVSGLANDPATMQTINKFVADNGGVQGMADTFQKQGLSGAFSSWVGIGANQAISPDQISKVLSPEQVSSLASSLGLDPAMANQVVSSVLPKVIDSLTPHGSVPNAV
jgi:uncharacterized protein YidB (DUF937 family)